MKMRRNTDSRSPAFSILELLVVGFIFSGIMALTSVLYFRGRDAVAQSTDKIDTAGRSRRAMDSLGPLVGSAVEIGGFKGLLVQDATPAVLTDACHVDITTRENFLDENYSPSSDFDVLGPYYRFRVLYDPDVQELQLKQLKLVPVEVDPGPGTRLLGRDVLGCSFERLTDGALRVILEVRAKKDDQRRPGGVVKTRLNAILVAPGSR